MQLSDLGIIGIVVGLVIFIAIFTIMHTVLVPLFTNELEEDEN
jgi:hypothetical protein